MFQKLSEKITIWGIQKKILQMEKRKIYEYGIEVILLNGGISCVCFLIALLDRQLLFFLTVAVFFAPLRMCVGGKHASKSETCFVCSIFLYWLMQRLGSLRIGEKPVWLCIMFTSMLWLWLVAPVRSKKRLYIREQAERNRKKARSLIMIDFAAFCIFYTWIPEIAYDQMISVLAVLLIALAGVIENSRTE